MSGQLKWTWLTFFAERPPGYDRVRNAEIGNKDFELDVLEEAYTTEHWLVRIYKVNTSANFMAAKNANSCEGLVCKSVATVPVIHSSFWNVVFLRFF